MIEILRDWHSEYCASLAAGCDHFDEASTVLAKEADTIMNRHAHELAEKIRLLPGDPWDEDEMWAQGVDYAANFIDPET